jgi:hypothetical protein
VWQLDLKRSQTICPVLELLDVGWVARKAADNMSQTLTIEQSFPDLTITYKTMMGSTTDELKFGEETTIVTGAKKRKQKILVRSEDDAVVTRTKVSLNRGILEHRYRLNPDKSGLFVEMSMSHRNGKSARCCRFYRRKGTSK